MTKFRFDRGSQKFVEVVPDAPSAAKSELCQQATPLGDGRWRLMDGAWVPVGGANGIQERAPASGLQIVKDIEPYKTVAFDKQTGKRPVISGRRQHREFLRNNGYIEIGNDYVEPKREDLSKSDRIADIKRAMGTL